MSPVPPYRYLRLLAQILAVTSLFLVGLGGFVRGTGAGLACPDWPLCYGRAIPDELHPGVAQEVTHRYLASIVSLGTFIFALIAFRNRREQNSAWQLAIFLLVVLFVQVILGGLTVLMRLNPFIVTGHLAVGTIFFQSVAFFAFRDFAAGRFGASSGRGTLLALAGLVYIQILLGGFVGSSGASLACPEVPLCINSQFLPSEPIPQQFIHMLHRLNGIFIAVAILALTFGVHFKQSEAHGGLAPRKGMLALSILVLVQIFAGFSLVYFRIPVALAVGHLVIAQMILLILLLVLPMKKGLQ